MIPLETRRMVLRAFEPDDAAELAAFCGEAKPDEAIGPRPIAYGDDVAAWIAAERRPNPGERGYWAAEVAGKLVGWFSLLPAEDDPNGDLQIGYLIRSGVEEYGLGTEGVRALVALAGRRVVVRTSFMNSGPPRSLQKIGFRFVREYPFRAGEPNLMVEYAYPS